MEIGWKLAQNGEGGDGEEVGCIEEMRQGWKFVRVMMRGVLVG